MKRGRLNRVMGYPTGPVTSKRWNAITETDPNEKSGRGGLAKLRDMIPGFLRAHVDRLDSIAADRRLSGEGRAEAAAKAATESLAAFHDMVDKLSGRANQRRNTLQREYDSVLAQPERDPALQVKAELRAQYLLDRLLEMTNVRRLAAIRAAIDAEPPDLELLHAIAEAPVLIRDQIADAMLLNAVRSTWFAKHNPDGAAELAELDELLGEVNFDISNLHGALAESLPETSMAERLAEAAAERAP